MFKKLLKIIKWGAVIVLMIVGLAIGYLSIAGIPRPDGFTFVNVPKLGPFQVAKMMMSMSMPEYPRRMFGLDEQGRLRVEGSDGALVAVSAEGAREQLQLRLPWTVPSTPVLELKSSPGHWLYLAHTDVGENQELRLLNGATGELEVVLAGATSVTSFCVAPDESFVLCYQQDLPKETASLVRVPLRGEGAPTTIATSFRGLANIEAISKDLRHAWVLESYSEQRGKLYRFDLATGACELEFAEEGERPFYNGTQFTWYSRFPRFVLSADESKAWYVRTPSVPEGERADFAVLHEYDLRSKQLTRLSPELGGDIGYFAKSHDERFLVYLLLERGFTRLRVRDLQSGEERDLIQDDPASQVPRPDIVWSIQPRPFYLEPQNNQVFFQTRTLQGTRLHVADLATGKLRHLDRPTQQAAPDQWTFETVEYDSPEPVVPGMEKVQAFLYMPKTSGKVEGKLPVLLWFHGGPDTLARPYSLEGGEGFAGMGFAILIPNYRGSAGYGVSYEKSDDQVQRPHQVEDVKAIVDWIKQRPDLDADRILAAGHSWGGFMVLASMARYPTLFRAGIAVAPCVLDPKPQEQGLLVRGWRKAEIGELDDPALQQMLATTSPVKTAHLIERPLLLISFAKDERIPIDSIRKVKDALEEAKRPYQYLELANSGHSPNPDGILEAINLFGTMRAFAGQH